MNSEEKMLKELLALTRENNDMLHAINSQRRISNFLFFVKWIIILGLIYGAYQASLPYFQTLTTTVSKLNEFNAAPTKSIQNIFMEKLLGK